MNYPSIDRIVALAEALLRNDPGLTGAEALLRAIELDQLLMAEEVSA